jgi:integrase
LSLSSKLPKNSSSNHVDVEEEINANNNNKDKKYTQTITKINIITKGQKPYIKRILNDILSKSIENVENICDFIISERNEIDIKESTVEWHVKVLGQLLKYHSFKNFKNITKEDILDYLNSLRKPSTEDPMNKSIGNRNNKQRVLLKFFKWLYNPNIDFKSRQTPECMAGIKVLPRREVSPYKPSDLWMQRDNEIFLRYCPSKRDKAFHSMAMDTSARPHELLNLKIKDIHFKISSNGMQYAEILLSGKTKARTVPLLSSLPYLKDWISDHPFNENKNSYLFISLSKNYFGNKLSLDGLLRHYKDQYRDKLFPNLLKDKTIPEADKAYIRYLLTKPFTLYVFRHSALTNKSLILKEHVLRDHAGWSMTSKMPQVYIHYFGTESSKSLLKVYGIEKEDNQQLITTMPKPCPNCNEPNKSEASFCIKCKMILSYESYDDVIRHQKEKDLQIKQLEYKYSKDINELRQDMENKFNKLFNRIDLQRLS